MSSYRIELSQLDMRRQLWRSLWNSNIGEAAHSDSSCPLLWYCERRGCIVVTAFRCFYLKSSYVIHSWRTTLSSRILKWDLLNLDEYVFSSILHIHVIYELMQEELMAQTNIQFIKRESPVVPIRETPLIFCTSSRCVILMLQFV